jgi:UDP-N-acetylmuramyl pentapeptide phosphotransferase/UDP-N-acetylglucosamine-1-phosphate transferase
VRKGIRVQERLKASRLAAAAALGFLLFNYPLLSLFDTGTRVLGVPVLWAYLFVVWALLVALLALIVRRAG